MMTNKDKVTVNINLVHILTSDSPISSLLQCLGFEDLDYDEIAFNVQIGNTNKIVWIDAIKNIPKEVHQDLDVVGDIKICVGV